MIRIKSTAGWKTSFSLIKSANFESVKRDKDLFLTDKEILEGLGYTNIEMRFQRTPGEVNTGQVIITMKGKETLVQDLVNPELGLELNWNQYNVTLSSTFQPEDEVEVVE